MKRELTAIEQNAWDKYKKFREEKPDATNVEFYRTSGITLSTMARVREKLGLTKKRGPQTNKKK